MNHTAAAGRHPLKGGPAIAAVGPFAAGVITGIVGLVVVAIGREERNLTLTSGQPTT